MSVYTDQKPAYAHISLNEISAQVKSQPEKLIEAFRKISAIKLTDHDDRSVSLTIHFV